MIFDVNGVSYDIPYSLHEISLSEFIKYYQAYGRDLDNQLNEILSRRYPGMDEATMSLNRDIDLDNHLDLEALSWYAYWSKQDREAIKDQPDIEKVLYQYRVLRPLLQHDEKEASIFPLNIIWNGDVWNIQNYKVDPSSKATFNEVIVSKEVQRQTMALGLGHWDVLPYLCCIFLRKEGEPFSEDLTRGERMELMQTLPLIHAIQVAFFLSNCVNIWKTTFLYLAEKEEAIVSLN